MRSETATLSGGPEGGYQQVHAERRVWSRQGVPERAMSETVLGSTYRRLS